MSLTFGPPITLDGPLPLAPPHSLINTPGVLISGEPDRWLNGVNIYPYPSSLPGLWDPCSAGTFRTKADGEGEDLPMFASFVIYLPITCSAMSIGDPEEFAGRAEIAMRAVESYAVEKQLVSGDGIATNPAHPDFSGEFVSAHYTGEDFIGAELRVKDATGQVRDLPVMQIRLVTVSEGAHMLVTGGVSVGGGGIWTVICTVGD